MTDATAVKYLLGRRSVIILKGRLVVIADAAVRTEKFEDVGGSADDRCQYPSRWRSRCLGQGLEVVKDMLQGTSKVLMRRGNAIVSRKSQGLEKLADLGPVTDCFSQSPGYAAGHLDTPRQNVLRKRS